VIFAQQRDGDFGPPHLDPVDAGGVASDVVIAWVLTMPAAALIGAVFYKLGELLQ
jgi:phosphate/sulfate permease